MDTSIEALTPLEEGWLVSQASHGQDLIERFTGSREVSLTALDEAYSSWFDSNPEPATVNDALNGFGVLFGQLLTPATELQFVIATDELGSDLALFGYRGCGDVLFYPVNIVVKRWERNETGFFEELHAQILASIASIQKANSRNDVR